MRDRRNDRQEARSFYRLPMLGTAAEAIRRLFLLLALGAIPLFAGPPFQTDDPDPVPWHHYEAYIFESVDRSGGVNSYALPAMEFNMGAAPNLQLHLVVPAVYLTPQGAYGIGDVELGAKYRFLKETEKLPEAGVFPLIELPTGDSRRGLGNGQLWARLPLWLQKSFGPWTTYGGGGYQINHAPEMKDSLCRLARAAADQQAVDTGHGGLSS